MDAPSKAAREVGSHGGLASALRTRDEEDRRTHSQGIGSVVRDCFIPRCDPRSVRPHWVPVTGLARLLWPIGVHLSWSRS